MQLRQRLRFGNTDLVPDLERRLAEIRSIYIAAAEMHLTAAQHAVFAAFLREVTLQSFGSVSGRF
jgi:hypothetical protein